jgi:alpha-tubulin suppressor-like RCC1 family protein
VDRPFLPLLLLALAGHLVAADEQPARHVVKVVGEHHKLVLWSDGAVVGWGKMDAGQLGPMSAIRAVRTRSTGLVAIALPGKAVDIAASEATSYALLDDGTVVAWGSGRQGELGVGPSGMEMTLPSGAGGSERPVRVSGLAGVVQIVAAGHTALARLADGTVRAWGARASGMVGDGQHPQRHGEGGPAAPAPVRVPDAAGITQLSAGASHVLALTAGGRVVTWGSNHYGALGRAPRRELPMDAAGEVPGLTDVVAVAGGMGVSTAVKRDGTVWVWGANWHGQFGNGERTDPPGTNHGYELVPQQVPGVANVVAITLGLTGRHTLALLKDGTLRGWGNTDWGQIGAGVSGTFQERPVTPKISDVRAVFAAGNNSFAVKTDGSFWAWGGGGREEWPLAVNTKTPVALVLP